MGVTLLQQPSVVKYNTYFLFHFFLSLQCSIQRAAVWVLDQYYRDFPVYNPALLNLPKSILSKKMSAFKVYNLGEGKIISPGHYSQP